MTSSSTIPGFPDLFSLALLDESFLPVRSEGTGALLEAHFASLNPHLRTYASDPEFGSVEPVILGVPEPSSCVLMTAGALLLGMLLRRYRQGLGIAGM